MKLKSAVGLFAVCVLIISGGCATPNPSSMSKPDLKDKVHNVVQAGLSGLGDGEVFHIIKVEKAAQLLDQAGQPQYASLVRTGEVGLQLARRKLIELGIIEPTAADMEDLLDGFHYVTSYTLIMDDGRQIPVGESNRVVAVDTPIAPTLPKPRIRTLSVKDIAPRIKNAADPFDDLVVKPEVITNMPWAVTNQPPPVILTSPTNSTPPVPPEFGGGGGGIVGGRAL